MLRILRRLLPSSLFLVWVLTAWPAAGQSPPAVPGQALPAQNPIEHPAPVLPYFIAILAVLAVLLVVCMPSRKS